MPEPIRALYAGYPERYPEYSISLQKAFEEAKLNVDLTAINNLLPQHDPALINYIIYSPNNGFLDDFSPYQNLKAVFSLRAGVEGILDNLTLPRCIPVTRMVDPGLREGMVEYVCGHVLRYHLSMDVLWEKKHSGEWIQLKVPLARQRTVGILGLGELGGSCADALVRLNFSVLGWSRTSKTKKTGVSCFYGTSGLEAVLRESDILVLLLPDTPATQNIINRDNISKCKDGVRIINVGRGSAIEEDDLLNALDNGKVAGATLDVFKKEPPPSDHGFWKHPNVLITPHVAAKTRPNTASKVIAENIRRDQNGEPLLYVVNRNKGY